MNGTVYATAVDNETSDAASIGVIARFAIEQYHDSRLYTGLEPTDQRTDAATIDTDAPEQS